MGLLGLDPDDVTRWRARLDAAALDVDDRLPVPTPDTGTTCTRSESGLAVLSARAAALADRLGSESDSLFHLSTYLYWTDADVAATMGAGVRP